MLFRSRRPGTWSSPCPAGARARLGDVDHLLLSSFACCDQGSVGGPFGKVAVARGEATGEVQKGVAGATACNAIDAKGRGAGGARVRKRS